MRKREQVRRVEFNAVSSDVATSLSLQDESLFGPPARLQQMTGNRGWNEAAAGGWWAGASSSSLSTADNRRKGEISMKQLVVASS